MSEPEIQILTLEEAAQFLRVAPERLETDLEQGKIEGLRIGNEWRIDKRILIGRLTRSQEASERDSAQTEVSNRNQRQQPETDLNDSSPTILNVRGEVRYCNVRTRSGMICVLSNYVLSFEKDHLVPTNFTPEKGETVEVELQEHYLNTGVKSYSVASISPIVDSSVQSASNKIQKNSIDPQPMYTQAPVTEGINGDEQAHTLLPQTLNHNKPASVYLADAALQQKSGALDAALLIILEGLARHQKNVDLYLLKSRIIQQKGDHSLAIETIRKGLLSNPNNPILQRELSLLLLANRRKESLIEAGVILETLIKGNKISIHDTVYKQFLALQKNNNDNTESPLASIVRAKSPTAYGTAEAKEHYERAKELAAQGKYIEALRHYSRAIRSGAGVDVYRAYFVMERDRGYLNEARRIIEDAQLKFPDHAVFYDLHGQMERKAGNFEAAIEIFEKGLLKRPKDLGLTWGHIQALFELGSETSLERCGIIFETMEQEGRLKPHNKTDSTYRSYTQLRKNERASIAYKHFRAAGVNAFVYNKSDFDEYFIDLLITFGEERHSDLRESFGLSDSLIVRCLNRKPQAADIEQLRRLLRTLRSEGSVAMHGRRFKINPNYAFFFIPVIETDIRDRLLNVLRENEEAIIPLDESAFQTDDGSLRTLRNLLSDYLGQRNLYESNEPVYGRPFFGREVYLKQLAEDINRGQFIGVYGLRKMGKTSLVKHLQKVNLHGEAVAYIDLQQSDGVITRDCAPLYWQIENELRACLEKNNIATTLFRLAQYERYSDVPYTRDQIRLFFNEDLHTFLDTVSEGNVKGVSQLVIILDELEEMLPLNERQGFDGYQDFFSLLRGLAQTDRYRGLISNVVIAANPVLNETAYWGDQENKVFVWYKSFFLSPLPANETAEMVRTLGRQMSVYWDDDAIEVIFAETNGHPFLTRRLCGSLAEYYAQQRPLQVTRDLVETHIPQFLREHYRILDQIPEMLEHHFPKEKQLLEQIALDTAPSSLAEESIRHLIGYHLIEYDEARTRYKLRIELLRRRIVQKGGQ
jgi:tetratricopeptide (TPR) repeat protein